jgi:hypothetical protein
VGGPIHGRLERLRCSSSPPWCPGRFRCVALRQTDVPDLSGLLSHLLTGERDRTQWYRGHGCELRSLRPSLMRRIDPYSAADMIRREMRLITRFRQRSLPFWPEGYPQTNWEQLFAMQHYGVPTRLLDWTENAITAAYFAADHDPRRCECEREAECRPTVWVLDPVALNRGNPRLAGYGDAATVFATSDPDLEPWEPGMDEVRFAPQPVALYGAHNSARIAAQQGTFTVAGKANESLDETQAVQQNDGVLERITIGAGHRDLMAELRMLGVTKAAVFPDLASLSADISHMELD